MWQISNKKKDELSCFNSDKYKYKTTNKLPNKTDMRFLYALLIESQSHNWTLDIRMTKHKLLKLCDMSPSKEKYERIDESLQIWNDLQIQFSGSFYDGIDYKWIVFNIIDSIGIEKKTKKIAVCFSPKYIGQIKSSKFFKLMQNQLSIKKNKYLIFFVF